MYNPIIVSNFTNPVHLGEIEDADLLIEVGNPICDDKIKLFFKISSDLIIQQAKFIAYGCATSLATANILCEYLINKNILEIKLISNQKILLLLGENIQPNQMHCVDIFKDLLNNIIDERESIIL